MADADKPEGKRVKKVARKSQQDTVKKKPKPSSRGNYDKTIKGAPEATLPATPPAAQTAGVRASGNLDQTITDPSAATTVPKVPPPPPPPAPGMRPSGPQRDAGKEGRRPSSKGNYDVTIAEMAHATDLAKTIQDNWGGTIIDEANISLSLKSQTQAAKSTRSSVSVKPRVFSEAPGGPANVAVETRRISSADYELIEVLGEGGMGVVYTARQTAVDRTIAVKMIKGEAAQQETSRSKFLAEAAVTADLDHPNIVPVYDLGTNEEGSIFYAMKKVKGDPWCDVIKNKDLGENLEILLRVCDAIAFAHDKGVVHRDLKPENVMLGDYGESLVMDWGLAGAVSPEAKADQITAANACCGTPCYMAPEMALGLADRIGKHSDVYLLGAILFEIVTGFPPHAGEDVMTCLMNAGMNQIEETPISGELIDIAHRAMANEPGDRYASVQDFQKAIRDYQEHFESLTLSGKAREGLAKAEETGEYNEYAKALYGFQEARSLWSDNEEALEGEIEARLLYAQAAMDKEDLDLADSLLMEDEATHQDLKKAVAKALKEQRARQRRLRIMTYGTYGGIAAIFIILTVATIIVGIKMREAEQQRGRAEQAAEDAKKQEGIAVQQKQVAQDRQKEAEAAKEEAETRRKEAVDAKQKAEKAREDAETARADAEKQRTIAEDEKKKAQDALAKFKTEQEARQKAEGAIKYKLKIQENKWWIFDAAKAKRLQQEAAEKTGLPVTRSMALPEGQKLEFVLIPDGRFGMGSSFDEPERQGEESLHEVWITKPFYLAKCEVTRAQWQAVMKGLPKGAVDARGAGPDHPVTHVSWKIVQEGLIPALQKTAPTGYTVRLPSEAEWEYACRAGTNTPYNLGRDEGTLAKAAWYQANSERQTHPVGALGANAWGLYDMHGNVAELVADLYDPAYYRLKLDGALADPVKKGEGMRRVFRGGGWINTRDQCRSAYRSWVHMENEHEYMGVRLALEPPDK